MRPDFVAAFTVITLGLSAVAAFSSSEGYALPEKEQEKPVSVINVSALVKKVNDLEARVKALESTQPSAASKSKWTARVEFSFDKANP